MNNQRQIVFEHRDALDQFEEAKSKQTSCLRRGTCQDEAYCRTCPARLEKERCKEILEEKSAALKALNNSIVERNAKEALQMRINRENERIAKKAGVSKRMSNKASKPVYSRKDLTLDRYLQHSKQEGKTDREIRTMYDIPSGSFTKFKKDLLAQLEPTEKEPKEAAATVEEAKPAEETKPVVAPPVETSELESNVKLREQLIKSEKRYAFLEDLHKQTEQSMGELEQQLMKANNLLTFEQQHTAELKQMVDYLENQLKATKEESAAATTATSDNQTQDYKVLYEQANEELEKLKIVAQDRSQRIESLECELSEFIDSNNNQTSKFRDYEILLLERLLQELYAGRN